MVWLTVQHQTTLIHRYVKTHRCTLNPSALSKMNRHASFVVSSSAYAWSYCACILSTCFWSASKFYQKKRISPPTQATANYQTNLIDLAKSAQEQPTTPRHLHLHVPLEVLPRPNSRVVATRTIRRGSGSDRFDEPRTGRRDDRPVLTLVTLHVRFCLCLSTNLITPSCGNHYHGFASSSSSAWGGNGRRRRFNIGWSVHLAQDL